MSHFISYKTKIENEYLAQDHNISNRDLTSLSFHLLVFQNHHTTIPTLKKKIQITIFIVVYWVLLEQF